MPVEDSTSKTTLSTLALHFADPCKLKSSKSTVGTTKPPVRRRRLCCPARGACSRIKVAPRTPQFGSSVRQGRELPPNTALAYSCRSSPRSGVKEPASPYWIVRSILMMLKVEVAWESEVGKAQPLPFGCPVNLTGDTMEIATSLSQLGIFEPHGHCFLWRPDLILLHTVSDSITAFAYYSIPITLLYFSQKRRDLPYKWIFVLLAFSFWHAAPHT